MPNLLAMKCGCQKEVVVWDKNESMAYSKGLQNAWQAVVMA
jgi:hypothetical protein